MINEKAQIIRSLPPANMAKISNMGGEVIIETNGELAAIEITYRGKFKGVKKLGAGWIIKAVNNKVFICCMGETTLTELLFTYVGSFHISKIKCATWQKNLFYGTARTAKYESWVSTRSLWNKEDRKPEIMQNTTLNYNKKIRKSSI